MKRYLRPLPFVVLVAAVLTASRCGSSAVTSVTGPTGTRCQAAVTNSSPAFGSSGGSGTVSISIDRECSWTASTPVSWIQLTSAANGQGQGSVSYRVVPNADPVARHGAIVAAQAQVSVAQAAAPCQYGLSAASGVLPAPGGSVTIELQTNAACTWSAKPDSAWATVAPASGAGSATITVTAGENTGMARTLTITIGSQHVDVQQQAAAADPPPPDPAPAPGPPPPPPPPPPTVDVTGRVFNLEGKCPTVTFGLDELIVQTTRATAFSGGGCKELKGGVDVEVRGVEIDNRVTATSVAIKKGNH